MTKPYLLALAGLLAANGAQAYETRCVNKHAHGCYDTIQDAVNASSRGDVIWVYPHWDPRGYRENVTVNVADLTIQGVYVDGGPIVHQADPAPAAEILAGDDKKKEEKEKSPAGCPAQIVDGCETPSNPTNCGGFSFNVAASGVTLRNFTVRHPQSAVFFDLYNDIKVDNFCVFDTQKEAITGIGNDIKVTDSLFQGMVDEHAAIRITGNEVLVRGNTLLHTDGIIVNGNSAKVLGNFIRLSEDNQCIRVDGNQALIAWNELKACGEDGISYNGTEARILNNTIVLAPDDEDGIDAAGNDIEIAYNFIKDPWEAGIEFNGSNSKIHHNEIHGGGDNNDAGIDVESGNDNLIAHNQVSGSSRTGIRNEEGSRNKYVHNRSFGNGQSGIRIQKGDANVVAHNEAFDNHGEGINNGNTATNTVIKDNRSFGNRTDVCNDGTIAEFDDNAFRTGGTATACVVEQLL